MGVTGTRLDLRSTQEVYSIPCMISITNIFQPIESPLILPYHAIPDITVPTDTGDKLMPTQGRGFPGFLPVCMQGTWGWLSSRVWSFPIAWKSQICIHAHDHLTWNNNFSNKGGSVISVSMNTQKYHARVQNACLQCVEGQGALQNFWKFSSLSLQSPILNQFELTHKFKNSTKKLFEFFSNKS